MKKTNSVNAFDLSYNTGINMRCTIGKYSSIEQTTNNRLVREDMKASSILGSLILASILIGAPLLVIPVHASTILPTITCWDGSTIGPVNGTYVAHCSPTPVCPHGQSPTPDRTCLPPCGGSGKMTCMWKFTDGNNTQSNVAEQFMYKTTKYTDYTFNPGYPGQTICDQQGLDCYALGLAAGSAHSGTTCPTLYNNQTKQQQFCSGYKDGSTNPAKYDSQGGIICDNENNTGCHWDITNATIGGYPCVHGPPYLPDKNGNCPPPMYMRSPTSQSNVSCGQILCYDLGWNRGQDSGFVDQHCPAAVDTLPVSVDNITIVNRGQVDAYCNGFSEGEQALANHPGVRSHVSSSMVLPYNATGYSDTLKIMPNGSAAEIGRPHIINQTHIDTAASINPDGTDVALTNCHSPGYTPCWDLGHFAGNQTSLQMGCPGLSNGPIIMVDWKNYWLLFPYRLNGANRKADVIDENEMRTMYPKTWEYLLDHKPILDYRENYSWKDKPNWHAYIYPKNLFEFTKPKLLVKVISNKSSFPFDRSGRYYFTGGGNGPIYGISLDNTSKVSFEYLMGVLNSTLLDYLVHKKSSRQHSGYYIYGKRFIERLPIKIPENIIEEKIAKKIELVVGDILSLAQDRINFINRWLEHVSQMHTDEITLMKILRSDLNNLQYGNSSLSSDVSPVWFSYVSFYPNKNQDILEKEYNDFRIYGHTKNQSIEVFGSYEAVEEKIYEFKFDNKELL